MIVRLLFAVRPSESVARTVNVCDDDVVDGVPEIVPVELPNVSPAGRRPETTAQVVEPEAPVVASDCEYDVPILASGRDTVLTRKGCVTDIV